MTSGSEASTMPDACFECGAPVRTEWSDYTFTYGADESATELSARIPVEVCVSCSAASLGHEAERLKHEAVCIHHGLLTPRQVRSIRDRHGLSRTAFAEVTGLGEATLHRWEHGIVIQNQANDRYLRLLYSADNIWTLRQLDAEPDAPTAGRRPRFRVLDTRQIHRLQVEQSAYQLRDA